MAVLSARPMKADNGFPLRGQCRPCSFLWSGRLPSASIFWVRKGGVSITDLIADFLGLAPGRNLRSSYIKHILGPVVLSASLVRFLAETTCLFTDGNDVLGSWRKRHVWLLAETTCLVPGGNDVFGFRRKTTCCWSEKMFHRQAKQL